MKVKVVDVAKVIREAVSRPDEFPAGAMIPIAHIPAGGSCFFDHRTCRLEIIPPSTITIDIGIAED